MAGRRILSPLRFESVSSVAERHACGDISLIDNGVVVVQEGERVPAVLRPYI